MKNILTILVLLSTTIAVAQVEKIIEIKELEEAIEVPFAVIENAPVFFGCESETKAQSKSCTMGKISEFINEKFNVYIADDLGIEGRVRINSIFKIDTEGNIFGIRVKGPHPKLEQECERVINLLPKFTPGSHNGELVTTSYSLPIVFQVKNNDLPDLTSPKEISKKPKIGDFMEGGIVFWIDPSNEIHGLVCAIEDATSTNRVQWDVQRNIKSSSDVHILIRAHGYEIGTGKSNTDLIIANHKGYDKSKYAAGLARAYRGGGYDDWFLPSYEELSEMGKINEIINKVSVENGGKPLRASQKFIRSEDYWSSSEAGFKNYANSIDIGLERYDQSGYSFDKGKYRNVRAIRAF